MWCFLEKKKIHFQGFSKMDFHAGFCCILTVTKRRYQLPAEVLSHVHRRKISTPFAGRFLWNSSSEVEWFVLSFSFVVSVNFNDIHFKSY